MSYRLLGILVLVLISSTPATAAVPAIRNITTIPPSPSIYNISYTVPTYKCSKVGLFKKDKRPSWPECYRAIRTLPQSHNDGTFHRAGSNNGYRLPMTEHFGRCRAHVEIGERVDAVSSWLAVTAALDQLSMLCRRQTSKGERVAGWLLMGPEDRIKVSLLGPDDQILGIEGAGVVLFSNGTELE